MHLLHNAAHFATIALEREHWFSLANQRALDLAAARERVRGLEGALAPFAKKADARKNNVNGAICFPQSFLIAARKALGEG